MKKKMLAILLCAVLALGLVLPLSAAYPVDTFEHIHDIQPNHFFTVDELLEKLNNGYELPDYMILDRFIVYGNIVNICCDNDCGYMSVSPHSDYRPPGGWPHTSCTNFFGHSWSPWGSWFQVGSIQHSSSCGWALCTVTMRRQRSCGRTNCNALQSDYSFVHIQC